MLDLNLKHQMPIKIGLVKRKTCNVDFFRKLQESMYIAMNTPIKRDAVDKIKLQGFFGG